MKPESLFRRRVRKWIEVELINVVVLSIQQVAICGDPDLVLCLNGYFVALELKAPDGRVSALQQHKLEQIRWKAGGESWVVDPDNWPTVQQRLLELDKGEGAHGKK